MKNLIYSNVLLLLQQVAVRGQTN